MFTGIIEQQLLIQDITDGTFRIQCGFVNELHIGQSIAHDGACMTITELHEDSYSFFAMQESFSKSNFGQKKVGDSFNIERCLRMSDRLDGHIVTGHIDTTGTVTSLETGTDGSLLIGISYATQRDKYTIEKGSICINGVSLTIVNTTPGYLSVRAIPHTQKVTSMGSLTDQDLVNLEFDMLAKYIYKQHTLSPQ